MSYLDAADDSGEPTSIALIARRVESYLEVVNSLREELDGQHAAIDDLEVRAINLSNLLEERASLRDDIVLMAETAATKASFASTAGRGAELRNNAAEKRKNLQEFEAKYAEDERRKKEVMRALETGQTKMMETRDQISRRMNIIDALLQRAEIEWPSYFFDENKRIKAKQVSQTSRTVRPRRSRSSGRGRTRIIRRRRAS